MTTSVFPPLLSTSQNTLDDSFTQWIDPNVQILSESFYESNTGSAADNLTAKSKSLSFGDELVVKLKKHLHAKKENGEPIKKIRLSEPQMTGVNFFTSGVQYEATAVNDSIFDKQNLGIIKWSFTKADPSTIYLERRLVTPSHRKKTIGVQMTAQALSWHEQTTRQRVRTIWSDIDQDNKRAFQNACEKSSELDQHTQWLEAARHTPAYHIAQCLGFDHIQSVDRGLFGGIKFVFVRTC